MHIFSKPISTLAVVALFALVACEKKGEQPAVTSKPATSAIKAPDAPETHAAPGVKPGSYEDWCGEHQVPESLCTRCNPSLIAAFKATGDWCAEHGLPESQCLLCNPDLKIERPPKTNEANP